MSVIKHTNIPLFKDLMGKGGRKKAGKRRRNRGEGKRLSKGRKLDKKEKKDEYPSTSTSTVPGRAINMTCLGNILTIVETF